jgi:phosphotransferase system HPr-like phosphotransfer protein
MIIAKQKLNENIIEYILYMMQIQDFIRACGFDIKQLNELVISRYKVEKKIVEKIREWYSDFIINMHNENVKMHGNLNIIKSKIKELEDLHSSLLKDPSKLQYTDCYLFAKPLIEEYRQKSSLKTEGDIEVCINALYSLMLLRLKNTEISTETQDAMQAFRNLVSLLAGYYHKKNTDVISNN